MAEKKGALVVKANKLIEAGYRLDLVEQRLILAAIVEARESGQGLDDGFLTIEAKRFGVMFGMQDANVYGQLKGAMDTLFNRWVTIKDIDPDSGHERVSKVRWISTASYIDGIGAVKLRFATDMVPYITRLETEFTSYRLEKIGNLSSAHAVRLYELLVQHLNIGSREIELAWLKGTLGLSTEYKAIKDFKVRVLDVAVSQINDHTDITVSYTQRKTGRAVTHLIFTIKAKAEPKAKQPKIDQAYVEKHARPGESYDQAFRRLLEERGQTRIDI
jgi:plasmid replication initiation protein